MRPTTVATLAAVVKLTAVEADGGGEANSWWRLTAVVKLTTVVKLTAVV